VGVGLSLTIPLISVRMEAAGFSAEANGFGTAMAGVATVIASPLIPAFVRWLGVRSALIVALAMAVGSMLGMAFIDDVYWWFPIRFVYSVALTILFVISEYTINALSPPHRRGLWIGIYSTSLYLGFAAGPVILDLVGTDGRPPFYAAIALFLIASVPIVAAGAKIPGFSERTGAHVLTMLTRAPALMLAALLFGAVETGGMGLLPVHALRNGFDAATGALFLTFIAIGNVVFQLPMGLLADRIPRSRVIAGIAILGLIGSIALAFLTQDFLAFAIVLFVWGGLVGGLYMVGLAELGARYQGADLASANAAFVMFYATGMLLGPPILGRALDATPRYGLFGGMAAMFVAYLLALVFQGRRAG
jgi:MFS family permease